jgi:hypothetical protein
MTGCATRWVVDSEVDSFSKLPPAIPAGATYRFDRLPSQQAREAQQQQIEAMAAPALERAGLRPDGAAARFGVQVSARVNVGLSPWSDPWFYGGPWGPGYHYGWASGWRRGWYGPAYLPPASPWYEREVSIVVRELPSNQVVYETRARNDGPYATSAAVLPVMFDAALQGFPNPPKGVRRVDIELPSRRQ